ncbi:unnamed protein product [Penicillium salamii]|uniref:Uncharacterized protein n=1 Tax=Penicillium salamii TaxID=1612424 RepID=A0A9W4IBY5_9EURO|nr:unnamed protein product [Penicillium salamii]CAG8253975.1 unnamed protein product [Penicillium salamii]CAG8264318.1 unnamed protein product [Penicillium salamii]CAG8343041.1 unnamed protein product [Penicillium salamii]CAG8376542.1 unnamed protein product [Penicillium salamii]
MDFLQSTSNASQSSTSELSFSGFSLVEYKSEDPLAQLAKEVKQQPFTTNKSLQKSLERRQRALEQDQTRDQHLIFTSVPPVQASRLSDERSRTSKYCRFFFNAETGILIAKVKLNFAHELAISLFEEVITFELHAVQVRRNIRPFRSTTVTIGNWTKEADCCWAPALTNARLSFVVEVGLSESTRQLALSARSWLETYSSSVKLVVTISIQRENPEIILRRWELGSRQSSVVTRPSLPSAHCTSFLKLSRTNNTTSVTGESYINVITTTTTQLDLPFSKIVNRPPQQPPERDLVIPEQELRSFAEDIWSVQGLL